MSLTKASYSMITGSPVNVFDFMTAAQIADVEAGTLALDVTDAILAAIASVTPTGGQVVFPVGKYSVTGYNTVTNTGGINLLGVQNVSLIGLSNGIYQDKSPEFVARTAGSFLFMLSANATEATYNIYIENITFNGNKIIQNVFTVNPFTGSEVTYNTLTRCNFLNVSPGGTLFSNQTAGAVFAESAIWYFQECGFACNGGIGELGNAVVINNYGAWGYVFDRCHFDTLTQYAHIRLIAGLIMLNNCQFDNSFAISGGTNVADIEMYSSAGLTMNNCNSGSTNPFLVTYNKSTTGKWDNYPIYINNCQSSATYPPTNGIQHITTNPIYVNGYYGSNVLLSGVPIEASAVGATYLYQTNRDANLFASQKAGASADALTLASNDLSTFLETSVDSTVGVGVSSYKPSSGYMPYILVASRFNLSTGIASYADNAAALAAGLVVGDLYRTVDTLKIVR